MTLRVNRRRFLQVGGAALALPFLEIARPRVARAQVPGRPKRLIVFHSPQGTVMPQWLPRSAEGDPGGFSLPYITEPLEPFRDRLLFVSGVDNVMPRFNEVGNAHINANYTVLTGRPFLEQNPEALSPGGPSVEQVISQRIAGGTPYGRLDFAVGGPERASGSFTPYEGSYFWYDARDPVAHFNDPFAALLRLFGDANVSPADAWAARARRSSVLDGVLQSFRAMRGRLGGVDRVRLEAHEEKLRALESRIAAGTGECNAPVIGAPPGYRYGLDDHVTAPIMNDLVTTALACDLTRVATITFANHHAPEFPWLRAWHGGRPIVDLAVWENWHAVVHSDYQPGMEHPYRWYQTMLADLLGKLAETRDVDGEPMLDTTLVLAFSEYSSGRHWNTSLPIVLAGNLPGAEMGRWVDFMNVGVERLTNYTPSGFTTNQLHTSLLHAFGGDDETFGFNDGELPLGPLPGLLG
jgi:hypothetical protein